MNRHETAASTKCRATTAWGVLGASLLLTMGSLHAAPSSRANEQDLAACDSPSYQTVLQAANAMPARAVWLSRDLIQWPGVTPEAGARFRLYHSARGRVLARPQQPVSGADGSLPLSVFAGQPSDAAAQRFKYLAPGMRLELKAVGAERLRTLHAQQLVLVKETLAGEVILATAIQIAGALDDLYAPAEDTPDLGVAAARGTTHFKLWAPTARRVILCRFKTGDAPAVEASGMTLQAATGIWSARFATDLSGSYYSYLVDVFVRGVGLVRNRVTDPYSVSLTTDSRRSYVAQLDDSRFKPAGWADDRAPTKVAAQTDMVIYELHVRDFSINDASVSASHRGKYLAFTESQSMGMRHLKALADAGLTDVHLLPVFDIASVPERGCVTPAIPNAAPDSEAQQAAVSAVAARDCFNWGYDPYHFNAPEGSYATDASDGARRIIELRQMVMALHAAGLRVGMDVVYNHTAAAGQKEKSVLDRVVPGYYQRLTPDGDVEQSTCCDNTATENRMMAKLMSDSVLLWAKQYRIDSFRFDLMGHQPRAAMESLQARLDAALGKHINLIGEGWDFGEVAHGARFVQASQLSLAGSGIGTFSDRARDAVRGGGHGIAGLDMIRSQGYVNGLIYDPNEQADRGRPRSDLLLAADMVRVGLAGTLRDYAMTTYQDRTQALQDIDYHGQSAGYTSQPGEVVNYVENHDNQTLFDINVYRLPLGTSREDRVRAQTLGAAIVAFSQGVAYFHAGQDVLRSKSMDANSFDSGDWFNRIDWSYRDNQFGSGAPPKGDNGAMYPYIKPRLANPDIKPRLEDIALARDMFIDLLRIRASSTLFRLRSAADVKARLHFHNTGAAQVPTTIVGQLNGEGYPGANFKSVMYFINVDKTAQVLDIAAARGHAYVLHPVHLAPHAADPRPAQLARFDSGTGVFNIPARSAVVFVEPGQ